MDLFNKKKVAELEAEISALNITLSEKNYDIEDLRSVNNHMANVINQNAELKRQNDAYAAWLEELELKFLELDLYGDLADPVIPDVNTVPEQKAPVKRVNRKSLSAALAGIKALEEKLASIPDGVRGTGGIDVIKNGKAEQLSFSSKSELEKILKDAKAGKFDIASQAGL